MKYCIYLFIILILLTPACEEDVSQRFFDEEELSIAAYLDERSEDFSMFIELLDRAGFKQAFNAYGSYTLFVFKNNAFQTYLDAKGFSSVSAIPVDEAKILLRYHTLKNEVTSTSLGLGKLPARNLEDDELVSSFDETGLQGIIINRESKVIERDIIMSNGIIHVIDKTMTPLVQSIVQRMEALGEYSIFIDATRATGLYTLLDKKFDTISATEINRVYFTLFAETDEIFMENGITDLNALKEKYDNGIGNPSDPADSLYKFMANHIIPEKAIFTKDLTTGNYQSYQGELINLIVDQIFQINLQGPDSNRTYLTFIDQKTDYQAKNGVFHTVNRVMDIFSPEPVEVIWDFLDQPYGRTLLALGMRDTPTETSLINFYPIITGTISGVFCHHPGKDGEPYGFMNGDALIMVAPSWDITFHTPMKIVKGRYQLYLSVKGGAGRATVQILIDGAPVGEPVNLNVNGVYWQAELSIDQVNLPETKSYDIRIVTVGNGQGQLDYVRFEPI